MKVNIRGGRKAAPFCFYCRKERIFIMFGKWTKRIMQGRYGTDSLFYAMSALYIILMLANLFKHSWALLILGIAVFVLTFMRVFSRNLQKRYAENMKFKKIGQGIKSWFYTRRNRTAQNGSYCFKRCPNCGRMLRLPRVKGRHTTRCPACSADFKVHVWFGARSQRRR